MKQMWKCAPCGTERQWGSIPYFKAVAAVKEANERRESGKQERLEVAPVLSCETCGEPTRHDYARDFFGMFEKEEAVRA